MAERARQVINPLTEATDADADREIYFMGVFCVKPALLCHGVSDANVQPKFQLTVPLMRMISGSEQNLHVEAEWLTRLRRCIGPEGLFYLPLRGRPWEAVSIPNWIRTGPGRDQYLNPFAMGMTLAAMTVLARRETGEEWSAKARAMVDGLIGLAVDEGDIAYFWPSAFRTVKDRPAATQPPTTEENGEGSVHASQRGASDLPDQSGSLGGVGEDELRIDARVDRLADDGQGLVLEGDDHQCLSPGAGAPSQLGTVRRLVVADRDSPQRPVPCAREGVRQSLSVGVVMVDQAYVVEAAVPSHARKHGTLGRVGECRAEEEAVVVGIGEPRRCRRRTDGRDTGRPRHDFHHWQRRPAGVGADDGMHSFLLHQVPGRTYCRSRAAGSIARHAVHRPAEHTPTIVYVANGEVEAALPVRRRLGRAGEVEQQADSHRLGAFRPSPTRAQDDREQRAPGRQTNACPA